jgi:hypothetical protein
MGQNLQKMNQSFAADTPPRNGRLYPQTRPQTPNASVIRRVQGEIATRENLKISKKRRFSTQAGHQDSLETRFGHFRYVLERPPEPYLAGHASGQNRSRLLSYPCRLSTPYSAY